MVEARTKRKKLDIRAITRRVSREGNLVQGQSDLTIDTELAKAAYEVISASENHYGGSEGNDDLRIAVAEKIKKFNGIDLDLEARPFQLMITSGGTGALIGIAESYLKNKSALLFEPFYPYHQKIIDEFGGKTEVFALDENLEFTRDALFKHCKKLKDRTEFPLRMIIVCTPSNPCGKIFSKSELNDIAEIAKELDLLVVSDEVYEHFVSVDSQHISIAQLPEMWERTITVNSFSKSWNISGWRLGYVYGDGKLLAPINRVNNIVYVCPVTPLQTALSRVLMARDNYYKELSAEFRDKRKFVGNALERFGFRNYESGSLFYIWTRIPDEFENAIEFNEMLMRREGVGATPGSAFVENSTIWDPYLRICIAREDEILEGAIEKLGRALS